MENELLAVLQSDIAWVLLAFLLGFVAKAVKLPPLVGFLAAGFMLNAFDFSGGELLNTLANLGITLLLFTVGLKFDVKSLLKPQVWATTVVHMSLITVLFGFVIFILALLGVPLLTDLNWQQSLLVAFALSFSSTVFVVKVLEEKGEMGTRHGYTAIGILIMQDLAAVVFLALTAGKLPTIWALGLLLLIPAVPLIKRLMEKVGHGELLILFGFVLALGGAEVFDAVGVKGDLGALCLGALLSTHYKAKELANAMMGFKDFFLVAFFLTIGLSGQLTLTTVLIGLALVPFMFIKSALFLKLLTYFKLRARTSFMATLNLSNYSEFGLIVATVGVAQGLLDAQWLIVMAIALSASLIVAAPLNAADNLIYNRYVDFLQTLQTDERLPDDGQIDTHGADVVIFGMGRVGAGAYERLTHEENKNVIGIDFDKQLIQNHLDAGRNVAVGNPSDPDFWEKIQHNPDFGWVLLAMPNLQANLSALEQLQAIDYPAKLAAVVRYADEEEILLEHGVSRVFNIYTEAGVGFADKVVDSFENKSKPN